MQRQFLNKIIVNAFRKRLIWLWLAGLSAREISCYTGASVSTVYRWVRRWQTGGSLESKHSKGRQPERVLEEYFSLEANEYLQRVIEASQATRGLNEQRICKIAVPYFPTDRTHHYLTPCTCNSNSFHWNYTNKVSKKCYWQRGILISRHKFV